MKVLVTGGGGFLGGAICRMLREQGVEVRSFSRQRYEALDSLGVEQHEGDLASKQAVFRAVDGVDEVYHVAAKAGAWGDYESFYRPNVLGTQQIIEACRAHGVRRLIYTSSPSVVFNGQDMEGVDESVPYPDRYHANYPRTKAEAERLVIDANGDDLCTISLRPHLIWGPEDTNLVPRILQRGSKGQLVKIRGPEKLIDVVYIDDAAQAHLLAADALRRSPDKVAGKVYFISSGEPVETWTMIDSILAAGGLPPVSRSAPLPVASFAGWCFETFYRLLGKKEEPRLTRWVVHELATAHWFDISAARRDLGYNPKVSLDEGLEKLKTWLDAKGC